MWRIFSIEIRIIDHKHLIGLFHHQQVTNCVIGSIQFCSLFNKQAVKLIAHKYKGNYRGYCFVRVVKG